MPHTSTSARRLTIGSLFSGYGGLDLAAEHCFDAETVWFSELNAPVAAAFSAHWPAVPNLGDISAIDWRQVEPVDVLCGGFPCQDVSTVGKQAGLAPGTRSGLWSHMATAIETLQPRLVVIENVRGLLSARATRPQTQGATSDDCNPRTATIRDLEPDLWSLGNESARSLRALGAVLGDLADLRLHARWIGLPASAIGAPHHRFRIFILAWRPGAVPDAARDGLFAGRGEPGPGEGTARHDRAVTSDHRPSPARTGWRAGQEERVGDAVRVDRDHLHCWGRYAPAISRWEHITGRAVPAPALIEDRSPRPAPEFVEWVMGLPTGWVTDPSHGVTQNQQITALGNGVLPLQAVTAIRTLIDGIA